MSGLLEEVSKEAEASGAIPPLPQMYYLAQSDRYVMEDDAGVWRVYNKTHAETRLAMDFKRSCLKDKVSRLSEVDMALARVRHHAAIDFCGELAGYYPGIYEMGGFRVAVTRGPKVIQAEEKPWPTIQTILEGAFNDAHLPRFKAWLKISRANFLSGEWHPSLALWLGGPTGAFKTMITNHIIKPAIGGRAAPATSEVLEPGGFNDMTAAAELVVIDDSMHVRGSDADRRKLGDYLRNQLASPFQMVHAKFQRKISACLRQWFVVLFNDSESSWSVLPPYDEGVYEKFLILRMRGWEVHFPNRTPEERAEVNRRILEELPGFLHHLETWDIPQELLRSSNLRYGMDAYHCPALLEDTMSDSDLELLDLIDMIGIWNTHDAPWQGTATRLREDLRGVSRTVDSSLTELIGRYREALGKALARLADKVPDRVIKCPAPIGTKRAREFQITSPRTPATKPVKLKKS